MDDKLIDVNFEDVNKKYYTIEEVSNILNIEQSDIAFYFEKLNDFLNITSVGMYQLFDDKDIKNLEKIKNLDKNKHMSMKNIRIFLNENKQEILLEKEPNNQVDKSVLNIFQTFANAMIEQNSKIENMYKNNAQLVNTVNTMIQYQEKIEKDLQEQKEFNKKQSDEYLKNNKKLLNQLDDVKKDLAISKDTNEKIRNNLKEQSLQIKNNFDNNNKIIEDNTKVINEFKCLTLEQVKHKQEPKGFLDNVVNLFHKKK